MPRSTTSISEGQKYELDKVEELAGSLPFTSHMCSKESLYLTGLEDRLLHSVFEDGEEIESGSHLWFSAAANQWAQEGSHQQQQTQQQQQQGQEEVIQPRFDLRLDVDLTVRFFLRF